MECLEVKVECGPQEDIFNKEQKVVTKPTSSRNSMLKLIQNSFPNSNKYTTVAKSVALINNLRQPGLFLFLFFLRLSRKVSE